MPFKKTLTFFFYSMLLNVKISSLILARENPKAGSSITRIGVAMSSSEFGFIVDKDDKVDLSR